MKSAATSFCLLAGRSALAIALVVPSLVIGQPMTWNYEYDAIGNLTKVTDPRGIVTTLGYDALSRRTLTTQPPAAVGGTNPTIGVAYDGIDKPKTLTDPRSLVTTYTTDGLGKTTTLASPDTGSAIKTYNDAGLVATSKDARNVTATYTYDARSRVTQIVYSGTGFTTLTDTFGYDQGTNGIGKLSSMTYTGGSTSWTYDGFGRLDSKVQVLGTAAPFIVFKVQKTYDAANRVATLTYPSGKVIAITYTNGQATALTVDGVNVATNITYTPFGAPLSWTWGSGTTHTRSFDLNGRMTGHPVGADVRTIGYDDAGRIITITHFPGTGLDQGFGYDDLDRLTQVTAGSTTRGYGYDLTGNRTQATVNASTDTYNTGATSNRLTGITGSISRTMTYDATGNITADSNITATYDARGRMKTVKIGAAANTTYVYDALGQRIKKSGGPAGTVHYVYDEDGKLLGEYDTNGVATREYIWLGDMPLAVLATSETLKDNPNATVTGTWATPTSPSGFYGSNYRTHAAGTGSDNVTWNLALATGTYKVYARWPANTTHSTQAVFQVTHSAGTTNVTVNQQLDGSEWVLLGTFSMTSAASKVKLGPATDGLVAADAVKAVKTDEASRIYFVHADHLNAPRALMDSANQLRWRWISDPFGLVAPEENPSSLGTFTLNLRLPGQVYDVESNLHYNYFRDYSPAYGRYVESDPIGLGGGINTYSYTANQPVRYVDSQGSVFWLPIGIGVGAVAGGISKALDPCASLGDIGRAAFFGGLAGGLAVAAPVAQLGWGTAAGLGAAAGFAGNVAGQVGTGATAIDWGQAGWQAAIGAAGGALGNYAGLGSALSGVRGGLSAPAAIAGSEGIATGVGVGVGIGLNALTDPASGGFNPDGPSIHNQPPCGCR